MYDGCGCRRPHQARARCAGRWSCRAPGRRRRRSSEARSAAPFPCPGKNASLPSCSRHRHRFEQAAYLVLEAAEHEPYTHFAQPLGHLTDLFFAGGIDVVDTAAHDKDHLRFGKIGYGLKDNVFKISDIDEGQ